MTIGELYNEVVKATAELAISEHLLRCCSYSDMQYYVQRFDMAKSAFEAADAKFKSELSKLS